MCLQNACVKDLKSLPKSKTTLSKKCQHCKTVGCAHFVEINRPNLFEPELAA